MRVEVLGRGFAWLDAGTHDSLLEASMFVQSMESRQGIKIACLEEIALQNSWITDQAVRKIGNENRQTPYGQYLLKLASV